MDSIHIPATDPFLSHEDSVVLPIMGTLETRRLETVTDRTTSECDVAAAEDLSSV